MAEAMESSPIAETKKVVNPRAEIDTSPPFESVKEAVDRFGGSGSWIPYHLLRLAASGHHEAEVFDVMKIEKETIQLERDLLIKQQETLNVLKELEATKKFVEDLKVNLMLESSPLISRHEPKLENQERSCSCLCSVLSPGLMFMELNQAKLNLNRTSGDLAVIQASVESLNKKMTRDMLSLDQINLAKTQVNEKVNFEAEQFKKMTEASKYEVIKAMSEIERTKNSIKMAEMRLHAARKMEEAAKAIEAIALTQRHVLLNDENSSDGITLSFEEYRSLTCKAQQAQDVLNTHRLEVPVVEMFEEKIAKENIQSRKSEVNFIDYKFKNSHPTNGNPQVHKSYATKEKSVSGFRSIGDILSQKLMLEKGVVMQNQSGREHVSLSEMLSEQSEEKGGRAEGIAEKHYFVQRKRFGFIQVPLSSKQSKKKTHPLNMR